MKDLLIGTDAIACLRERQRWISQEAARFGVPPERARDYRSEFRNLRWWIWGGVAVTLGLWWI